MRAGLILAAVLLLAACAGAPSPSSPPATPAVTPQPTPGEALRILATGLWGDMETPFSVAAATDADELEALWARVGQGAALPLVDFDGELVLYLGMAGSSSCPETFERLVVDDTQRLYAEWGAPPANRPCTDDLAAQGVLLAVLRSELPAEPFQFWLRQQPVCPDCADHPDQMVVDPR